MVKLVIVPVFQIVFVVEEFNTILPVPKFIVLAVAPELANKPVVSVNEPSAKVPAVRVTVLVLPNVRLSCKVQVPPAPLNVKDVPIVIPPLVIVLAVVEVNVTVPVEFQTVPAMVDQLPATVNVGVVPVAKVTVPFVTFKFKQFNAPVMVTVYVPA